MSTAWKTNILQLNKVAVLEILLDRYALREFLGVLAAGDVFLGPSTGPLHLASALGLATVGIYPPVPAMSPRRWGPRGSRNRVLVPDVPCPVRHACRLERCPLPVLTHRKDAPPRTARK